MPTYDFINTKTQEVHSKLISIADREKYLSDNPDLEVTFLTAPVMGDSYRMGMKKPDAGFNEVLSKIIERTPSATGLNSHLSRSTKRVY